MEKYIDIKGYEGIYQVSNLGNIKSIKYLNTERVLRVYVNPDGYEYIGLWKYGMCAKYKVHLIVAHNWLDKIEGKKYINHKDGNKTNNKVDNLEWCTKSENTKHAYDIGLMDNVIESTSKVVVDINTGVFYNSAREVARLYGYNHSTLYNWLDGSIVNKTSFRYA